MPRRETIQRAANMACSDCHNGWLNTKSKRLAEARKLAASLHCPRCGAGLRVQARRGQAQATCTCGYHAQIPMLFTENESAADRRYLALRSVAQMLNQEEPHV